MRTSSPKSSDFHTIAYFSMEVGLGTAMPTYSGGLGVLAGDTLRAATDLDIPMVGVTLLHRKGYFHQHLDEWGTSPRALANGIPKSCWNPWTPVFQLPLRGGECGFARGGILSLVCRGNDYRHEGYRGYATSARKRISIIS